MSTKHNVSSYSTLSGKPRKPHRVAIDVDSIAKRLQEREISRPAKVSQDSCSSMASGCPDSNEETLQETTFTPHLAADVPPLSHIYLYLTEGCNQACQHCWIAPSYMADKGTGGHVSAKRLLNVCEKAKLLGLTGVKLTGGEPLLHPEFSELVYGLKELELSLWIESNLTLLTPNNSIALLETMNFISTSLDSATPEGHDTFRGVPNSFHTTCEAIRLLAPHIPLQIIMSIHSGNAHEVEKVILLAKELGAVSVKFNLIRTQGRADRLLKNGRLLDVTELIRIGRKVEDELGPKYGMEVFYSWPPAFWRLSSIASRHLDSCGIHHLIGILGSGHYGLCGVGKNIPELVYGTLDDDFSDIWNYNESLKKIRDEIPNKITGICADCIFKKECKAYCIANNYHDSGRLNAPHWFCEESYREGLFPTTRLVPN